MPQSLKAIARRAGLSVATVSRALGGSPLVTEPTRARVLRVADKLGYARPPLVGAIMSSLRRSAQQSYLGNLGLVCITLPGQKALLPFHAGLVKGARDRASALGFKLDVLSHVAEDTRHATLNRVLRTRGVTGLIFLNARTRADFSQFDWSHFAATQIDHAITSPVLHASGIDHHRTIHMALTRLAERGYKRFGFFIETHKDIILAYKWSGAFAAFQRVTPALRPVPELEQKVLQRPAFLSWFRKHKPDILVGHKTEVIAWLRDEGLSVPGDAGFFNLNLNESPLPCAGLDLEARLQGAIAVESVVTQIHQFERGVPAHPKTIGVEGRWVDGPTIRPAL
jgi:LacI family transcriptional regulator